jgi:3-phytase/alkaline phosphatase D
MVTILIFAFAVSASLANTAKNDIGPQTVVSVELLGMVTFDTGYMFEGTEVGGISGITYDSARGVYYALSDDRSSINPARYYSVDIDLSDGTLEDGDVTFLAVTTLRDKHGNPFAKGSVDPEAIEMTRSGHLYISSEGDADGDPVIDPFVKRFNPAGKENRALPVPDKFLPDGLETVGIRDNLAFESLTSAPDMWYLYTATENALVQDGPKSTLADSSPSRLLEYSLKRHRPGGEFVYMVDPIPFPSDPPGGFADNGLVDLQAIDNFGTFMAMERSYASGVGNTVKIFETSIDGATDVSDIFALDPVSGPPAAYDPMTKALVVNKAARAKAATADN